MVRLANQLFPIPSKPERELWELYDVMFLQYGSLRLEWYGNDNNRSVVFFAYDKINGFRWTYEISWWEIHYTSKTYGCAFVGMEFYLGYGFHISYPVLVKALYLLQWEYEKYLDLIDRFEM